MSTRRYQKTQNRHQEMLLPSRVEDYVSENNTVRAIDAYVDTLDLADLGFKHANEVASMRGQPQQRMDKNKTSMKKRASLVEHPFGTLKHRAGMHHFLMRGLEKCRGEFSLMVICYNFTRIINLLGTEFIRYYCVQRQEGRLKI